MRSPGCHNLPVLGPTKPDPGAGHDDEKPLSVRRSCLLWFVSVVQCFQEFNDIGFVLCGHRRRFVGMPVEGRVGYVDIEVVLCRDVWLMGL
jgi:hypothetical protein